MYSVLIDSFAPACGLSIILFFVFLIIGFRIKKLIIFSVIGMVVSVITFPISCIFITKVFIVDKYDYEIKADTWDDYQVKVSSKRKRAYIPEGAKDICVWHTENSWWAAYNCSEKIWDNFQGVWAEKMDLVKVNKPVDLPVDGVYPGLENYKNRKFDLIFETPVASNGSKFSCYRDSESGFVISFLNRW